MSDPKRDAKLDNLLKLRNAAAEAGKVREALAYDRAIRRLQEGEDEEDLKLDPPEVVAGSY